MKTPGDDKIIGVPEAAVILDTSDQMVRRLARAGRVPAYRLPGGRAFKFFRNELEEHVKKYATPLAGEGDAVLDTRAVGELLGMDIQQVRKYARENRIPSYRHKGRRGYEFSRNEVLAHLRSSRLEAGGGQEEAGGGGEQGA